MTKTTPESVVLRSSFPEMKTVARVEKPPKIVLKEEKAYNIDWGHIFFVVMMWLLAIGVTVAIIGGIIALNSSSHSNEVPYKQEQPYIKGQQGPPPGPVQVG
jgi:hypothetical protein